MKVTEKVILVDELNREIGEMEKIEAHKKGRLHRAISVFIFNSNHELLLQQRASHKYHSANLWTNTCCTHPRPGEDTLESAHRRLSEEMGMYSDLNLVHEFVYRTPFDNGLVEYEYDHVYMGFSDVLPMINPEEASDYKYMNLQDLSKSMQLNPEIYTSWFKICFDEIKSIVLEMSCHNATNS